LKPVHKQAIHEAAEKYGRDGPSGRVGSFTTVYRFPDNFVALSQYFSGKDLPTGQLKPIPLHHDIQDGSFGFRRIGLNSQEPINQVPLYAIACAFIKKEDEDEEGPGLGTHDLNRDLARKFNGMSM
jgi:hypothetical protein